MPTWCQLRRHGPGHSTKLRGRLATRFLIGPFGHILAGSSRHSAMRAYFGGGMTLRQTATFFGEMHASDGMPDPWHHYLLLASPGPTNEFCTVSVIPLTRGTPAEVTMQFIEKGGPDDGLARAVRELRERHSDLNEFISNAE